MPLLNQLAIHPGEFLTPFALFQKVELLRTYCKLFGVKKVGIERDSLEMWGRLERAFILSKEERLHECSVELAGHVKDLNDRLKKMDEDVYRGEL